MQINDSELAVKVPRAHAASVELAQTTGEQRNEALQSMEHALVAMTPEILEANAADMEAARKKGTPEPLLDRLFLDEGRIEGIVKGLSGIRQQEDPLGKVLERRKLYNGIELCKVSVPLGVVAIIYEARPNVTADAAGICLKSGNACILRGGSLAQRSCVTIGNVLSDAAAAAGLPKGAIQVIENTSHDVTDELMSLHGQIDLLVPRGGAGLISYCVENSKVPVIETGTGNCHIYVHESADFDKALRILVNAKCQRPGVCNAAESLLCDAAVANGFLPRAMDQLRAHDVELVCDERALAIAQEHGIEAARGTDDDWSREYLDLKMSVQVVDGLDDAIDWVNRTGTRHSEAIVAEDAAACERFLERVDAAAVYANASTRFSDGGEFGLGAELGISTQKLHARGPMGISALTSYKYLLRGDGQVRA
jgi:glutamate-5-semialdehyde dehydrogenase